MSKVVLSLENLGELDGGRAAGIINAALKQAVSDLDDRGDDFKAREVTITVRMEKSEKSGHVFATVKAKTKMPEYATGGTLAEFKQLPRGEGVALLFQPLSPHDPDQEPLPEMEEPRRK